MTRQEQLTFVRDLTRSISSEIEHDIRARRIPESWDGAELRQLLADRYERSVYRRALMGSRRREYVNTILVNNL